jgi:D-glycero-D-manno-heptose 1,7-bisphosphate phosphatase
VKLIIVDRDGVVSRDADGRTTRPEDWQSLPGSADALARLDHAGYRIVVMADRSQLARGACDMSAVNAVHTRMIEEIGDSGGRVDAVVFVPPADATDRAQTVAATLADLLARLGAAPSDALLVTDSQPDLDAAHACGCRPVLVLTGHGRDALDGGRLPPGTAVRVDLASVAAELAP